MISRETENSPVVLYGERPSRAREASTFNMFDNSGSSCTPELLKSCFSGQVPTNADLHQYMQHLLVVAPVRVHACSMRTRCRVAWSPSNKSTNLCTVTSP